MVGQSNLKFVLLDHNHFKVEGLSYPEAVNAPVISVIDHHVDEGLYQEASPRIVRTCGSCTTLVIEYFQDRLRDGSLEAIPEIALLASSAILVDTASLAKDATETDKDGMNSSQEMLTGVINMLRSTTLSATSNEQDWIRKLQTAKRDVKGLSTIQLLKRDYKEWDLGAELGMWGISSVTASLEYLLDMPDWKEGSSALPRDRNLAIHIVMVRFTTCLLITDQTWRERALPKHG